MNDDFFSLIAFIAAMAVAVGIIAWFFYYIIYFRKETEFIYNRLYEADNDDEYDYWQKELRQHYLCLIPFVTEKNVAKVYGAFYKKKTERKNNGIFYMIAPSIIGIGICLICLCQMSWAWFTATNVGMVSPIKTPNYSFDVTVTGDDGEISGRDNVYSLSGNEKYTVVVKAKGTDGAMGYIKMTADGKTYFSEQIKVGSEIKFTVNSQNGGDIIIDCGWGSFSGKDRKIKNDVVIEFIGVKENVATKTTTNDNSATSGENNHVPTMTVKESQKRETATENMIDDDKQSVSEVEPTQTEGYELTTGRTNGENE